MRRAAELQALITEVTDAFEEHEPRYLERMCLPRLATGGTIEARTAAVREVRFHLAVFLHY